jgi:hypothetical protein
MGWPWSFRQISARGEPGKEIRRASADSSGRRHGRVSTARSRALLRKDGPVDRLGRMERHGWAVGPATVLAGLTGRDNGTALLDGPAAVAYAADRFVTDDAVWVAALAVLPADAAATDVRDELAKLGVIEGGSGWVREVRKWLVLDLEDALDALPADDHFEGLAELAEFWTDWGLPDDMPEAVQSRTRLAPAEFYRQDVFDRLVAEHRAWRDRELEELRVRRG